MESRALERNKERRELASSLLMSAYFFLVISAFWILKPLKKALFLRYYKAAPLELFGMTFADARAEQFAKILNMLVAAAAAALFVTLSKRFRREKLTFILAGHMLVAFAAFARLLAEPAPGTVWSFYVFGDLFNMLMVASFFAFQHDIASPALATRTYGTVVLGGVLGGVFGSTFLKLHIRDVTMPSWLWVCFGLTCGIVILAAVVARLQRDRDGVVAQPLPTSFDARAGMAGAALVRRSPYLVSIVALVAIYEVVSAVLDFQFSATTAHFLGAPHEIDEHLATVFMITNLASLCVQVLATRWVMQRFGIAAALSILPLAVLAVSSGFVLLPGLWVGSFLSISDNALSYSLNQSARESLYVPTTPREKYEAKAFIDVFVQRAAKVAGLLLIVAIDGLAIESFSVVRLLSLLVVVLAGIWLWHARRAGGRFDANVMSPAE